jgi:acyl-CoA synthetase (AMP-forming)/AMP-acid ligase II
MSDASVNPLWDFLSAAVAERGAEPFLTDLRTGSVLSYEELRERSRSAATWLAAHGVVAGDRVAYLTKNEPAFFPLLFGCTSLGAALVPVSEDSVEEEIESVLEDCGARLVLCDQPDREGRFGPVTELCATPASADGPLACPDAQDAIIIYTSGTTGRSKGVVLSHRNLMSMSATLASVYGYQPGMRFLSMLPYYHINAPIVTGLSCIAGRTHVFVTDTYGFTNARLIFNFVEQHRLNVLSLTPSIMASLLKFNPSGTDCDISSVAFGLVGTAHLNEKLWRRFEQTFGIPCYQGYGLTETTTWATMTPPDERKRYDSAGVAIGSEIMIDRAGGEVLIRGDIVMNGYHNRKSLTRKQFKDGWLRTGDIGRIDDDGQLFITGRIKNIIKRKGILLSPEEIDEVVRRMPEVTDACTVGVPDELLGERVVSACVVESEHLEAVQAHTRGGLSAYKYPDEFLVVGEIPRTDMGKPDLAGLRKIVSGEKATEIVKSFDAYRFRRARSEDMPAIEALIQHALLMATTVEFVGFWGVGSRSALAAPDVTAMDRLKAFVDAIANAAGRHLGRMTLILADMHARCNRVPAAVHEPYFEAIGALAKERGIQTTWLSAVWSAHGLDFEDVLDQMKRDERLEEWESFPLRADFLQQAVARCGGDESLAEDFAYRYFLTITTENPALAASFEGRVFFTYNGPEFRIALPRLPMLHLHSLKPGTAAKPWFLPR